MRRILLTAALLATACSSQPAAHPDAAPSARVPSIRLSTALDAMYANRYVEAGHVFTALTGGADRSATALADYALFLNYAGQQEGALGEAGLATTVDPLSGLAFAVRCRVNDWAGNVADAVRDGRRGVRLAPAEPLTHLLLSEALADSGRLTDAQAEIDSAARLIRAGSPAFLRAEMLREQGNLAGDRGDNAGRLASFTAAQAEQPGWLYRRSEVVDATLAAGNRGEATRLLSLAAAAAPADPLVLATLANEAVGAGDAADAADLFARAAAASPRDPRLLVAAGAVAVAARQDTAAGAAYFEAALSLDRTNPQALGYLVALGRYLHRDAQSTARLATAGARQAADAQTALAEVNRARASAALPPVHLDPHLSASAESHSYYWLFNNFSPSVSGLGIHQETPGLPGYSARFPWTRATGFGYPNQRVGEDIDHRGDPVKAVEEWVNSVYHRFAIVRPDLVAIGYGEAEAGPLLMEDLEFGFAPPSTASPVLYPGDGQGDVPAMFVDNELPDPVPAGQARTTGCPVTVTFGAADSVQVDSFTLQDAAGQALAAYSGTPSGSTENSAWLLPHAPMEPGAAYTARVAAIVNGHPYDRTWTFTTAA